MYNYSKLCALNAMFLRIPPWLVYGAYLHGVVSLCSKAQQCIETGQGIHFVPVFEFQLTYFSGN